MKIGIGKHTILKNKSSVEARHSSRSTVSTEPTFRSSRGRGDITKHFVSVTMASRRATYSNEMTQLNNIYFNERNDSVKPINHDDELRAIRVLR